MTTATTDSNALAAQASSFDPMARERCDRCGAAAYVLTVHPNKVNASSQLGWCSHHFADNEKGIAASGGTVLVDIREMLVARETRDHA